MVALESRLVVNNTFYDITADVEECNRPRSCSDPGVYGREAIYCASKGDINMQSLSDVDTDLDGSTCDGSSAEESLRDSGTPSVCAWELLQHGVQGCSSQWAGQELEYLAAETYPPVTCEAVPVLLGQLPQQHSWGLFPYREQEEWQHHYQDQWHDQAQQQVPQLCQVRGSETKSVAGGFETHTHCLPVITPHERTTIMLKNLPNSYTSSMVLKMIDDRGFAGRFDFFYLPVDFDTHSCLGYAFINMLSAVDALHLWSVFDGFCDWVLPTRKHAIVSWSQPQGRKANIERYRNSPVMHPDVPDDFRPMLFSEGARVAFPAPTKSIRPPPRFRRAVR